MFEESGIKVKARKLVAVFDHSKHRYKAHHYRCYKIYLVFDLVVGVRMGKKSAEL